jgi:uncharacterized protein
MIERVTAQRAVLAFLVVLSVRLCTAGAAEVIPPAPPHYFNDYAGVVSPSVADELNRQLEQFERDTSNQIVVAVFPKMQSDSDIADYTFRVKESWHVGQKGKNNGAVLFVFIQDHKMFIQVNYGLEGVLPDATCKEIIDQEITPNFKTGNYEAGLRAGINAILSACKGEFKGTGSTVNQSNGDKISISVCFGGVIVFIFIGILLFLLNRSGDRFYQRHARSLGIMDNLYLGALSMPFNILGGGGSGGGGFSGGGGGGFSGGGGTGGGGGAGGSW